MNLYKGDRNWETATPEQAQRNACFFVRTLVEKVLVKEIGRKCNYRMEEVLNQIMQEKFSLNLM